MMVCEHRAMQAKIKIVLHQIGSAHMAAAGMLGRVTVHFKNHNPNATVYLRKPNKN